MKFARWHTQPGVDPISRMRLRTFQVHDESLIAPMEWTEPALEALPTRMNAEGFASHLYESLRPVRQYAEKEGLFASGEDASAFKDECAFLLASRKIASTILLDPPAPPLMVTTAAETDPVLERHQRQYQRLMTLPEADREPYLRRLKERAMDDGVTEDALSNGLPLPTTETQFVDWPENWLPELDGKVLCQGNAPTTPGARTAVMASAYADTESRRFDIPGFRKAIRAALALNFFLGLETTGQLPENLGVRATGTGAALQSMGASYDSPQGQAIVFCIGAVMMSEAMIASADLAEAIGQGSVERQEEVIQSLQAAQGLVKSLSSLRLAPPPQFDPSNWFSNTSAALEEALEKLRAQPPLAIAPFWLLNDDGLDTLLDSPSPGLAPPIFEHPNAQLQIAESFESGGVGPQIHTILFHPSTPPDLALAKDLGLRYVRFVNASPATGKSGWQEVEVLGMTLQRLVAGQAVIAVKSGKEMSSDLSAFVSALSLHLESGLPLDHLREELEPGSAARIILDVAIR